MLRKAILAFVLVAAACLHCHSASAADEGAPVALSGSIRPEAAAAADQGALPRSTPLDHILIQLNRKPTACTAYR
jgi:hypothetical protein